MYNNNIMDPSLFKSHFVVPLTVLLLVFLQINDIINSFKTNSTIISTEMKQLISHGIIDGDSVKYHTISFIALCDVYLKVYS